MPPAAMASSVVVTMVRARSARSVSESRATRPHSQDRVTAGGNFGAGPKPPHCGSNDSHSVSTAASNVAASIGALRSVCGNAPSIAAVSRPATSSTASRFVRHASATAPQMRTKPGIPWRSSLGKYVPAWNGRPSGRNHTLMGQPPWPVIVCVACM